MVKPNWDTEELIENWTLLPQELELVRKKVGGNQIGFALLLKHFQKFACFPEDKSSISQVVISYIASQVNLLENSYSDYDWQGRSAKVYRVEIRSLFNFRVASVQDSEEMVTWLIDEILPGGWQRFVNFTPISPSKPCIDWVLLTRNQRKIKIKCWRFSIKIETITPKTIDVFGQIRTQSTNNFLLNSIPCLNILL